MLVGAGGVGFSESFNFRLLASGPTARIKPKDPEPGAQRVSFACKIFPVLLFDGWGKERADLPAINSGIRTAVGQQVVTALMACDCGGLLDFCQLSSTDDEQAVDALICGKGLLQCRDQFQSSILVGDHDAAACAISGARDQLGGPESHKKKRLCSGESGIGLIYKHINDGASGRGELGGS